MPSAALRSRVRRVAVHAALAGAGAWIALVCTHTWAWWSVPLAIALLVARLDALAATAWRAGALAGLVFGAAWIGAAVWWLFISMHRYGGLAAPMAVAAVALLALALALYLAAAGAAYVRWRSGRVVADASLFASLWLLAEWARGVVFTGFPWAASGYTQIDGAWTTLAPWVGVYGVGAWLAGLGALVGSAMVALARGQRQQAASPLALAVAWGLAGALVPTIDFTRPVGEGATARALTVTLLQPAVPQDEKFAETRIPRLLDWLDAALREARSDLVVAPETAMPLLPAQRAAIAPGWWESLQAHFASEGRLALIGAPMGSHDVGYTNSAVALGPGSVADYRYDKAHLVPFGEFIPFGFRWFTELMRIPLGDFSRGPVRAPSLPVGAERLGPNICYEDLFGEELARRMHDPTQAPTVFVNLSNIAWFGPTVAVPQHLGISRMRALELQRPMLRATNTGATAVIDHHGRVVAALPPFARGVLDAEVHGREGLTPYAWWVGRLGLWPLFLLALAVVVWRATAMRGLRSVGQ